MRKNLKSNLTFVIVVFLLSMCGRKSPNAHAEFYTCPMHPTVKQSGPGVCLICRMDLVQKGGSGESTSTIKGLSGALNPANEQVLSTVRSVSPVWQNPEAKFEAKGIIVHNAQTLGSISATVDGRIEKLFVRSDFQPVKRGQKILELYSPELIVAEEEFLMVMKEKLVNADAVESARRKLSLLGVSDHQLDELVKTKHVPHAVVIYSAWTGYVAVHNEAAEEVSSSKAMPPIREGAYVTKGQTIFTVVSHRDLWGEFDIHPQDLPLVHVGEKVVVTVDNSYGAFVGSVDRIQPLFGEHEGLVKARVRLTNPHHQYHAGQHISATFRATQDSVLWIPITARLDKGLTNIVFLKQGNGFRPVRISVGTKTKNWIQVTDGLSAHDSIAYNASFLMDSDDFVKVN